MRDVFHERPEFDLALPQRRFRLLAHQGMPDRADQRILADPSLDEEVLRAIPHGGDGQFVVIGSGQHDHRDVRCCFLQRVERL